VTTRVKICGVTRPEDARAACEAGADAIGMIFAPSRRTVTLAQAQAVVAALPPWFPVVGVFRNAGEDEVRAVLAAVRLTHLQFHGDEEPAFIARFERPAIRSLPLLTDADEARALAALDAHPGLPLLVDAAEGGSGQACDWSRAARLAQRTALILAGGLTPETVAGAVRSVRPAAVDVSSGVETCPGVKDHEAIRAFIRHARGPA
jgi:phosphoribosylanthranilate isomerase